MNINLNKTSWYPVDVFDCNIDTSFCDRVIKFVEEEKHNWEKDLDYVKATTTGYDGIKYPIIKEISEFICSKILPVIGQSNNWKYNNWWTKSAWINFYQKGDAAVPHCHYLDHYSAVLIIKPAEGNLVFVDPRKMLSMDPKFVQHYEQRINEEAGKLILFPNYLMHYVTPCESERITIAFNFQNDFRIHNDTQKTIDEASEKFMKHYEK